MPTHSLMGGKLHVYKRENSQYWQCSSYLSGKNRRVSTKEDSLSRAKEFAEDWYLELRGKHRRGEIKKEKTFRQAANRFTQEYEVITEGQRSPLYIKGHNIRLRLQGMSRLVAFRRVIARLSFMVSSIPIQSVPHR